jgi:hypothetical protein
MGYSITYVARFRKQPPPKMVSGCEEGNNPWNNQSLSADRLRSCTGMPLPHGSTDHTDGPNAHVPLPCPVQTIAPFRAVAKLPSSPSEPAPRPITTRALLEAAMAALDEPPVDVWSRNTTVTALSSNDSSRVHSYNSRGSSEYDRIMSEMPSRPITSEVMSRTCSMEGLFASRFSHDLRVSSFTKLGSGRSRSRSFDGGSEARSSQHAHASAAGGPQASYRSPTRAYREREDGDGSCEDAKEGLRDPKRRRLAAASPRTGGIAQSSTPSLWVSHAPSAAPSELQRVAKFNSQ